MTALHQAIKLLIESGLFRQAADREKEIANIYAQDGIDQAKARDSFVRAGDWYKQEDANAYGLALFNVAGADLADLADLDLDLDLDLDFGR